jgi:hypothetical protein
MRNVAHIKAPKVGKYVGVRDNGIVHYGRVVDVILHADKSKSYVLDTGKQFVPDADVLTYCSDYPKRRHAHPAQERRLRNQRDLAWLILAASMTFMLAVYLLSEGGTPWRWSFI